MTFSTDWDIEKYRVEHESEDHWDLRRRFLEAHKEKYPEERLVCLAQVFYNVEFLGCRYPDKTMRLVAQLSDGVADDHREKMKSKLQRTFVQASDAASTKAKGRGRNEDTAQNKRKFIDFQKADQETDQSNSTTDEPPNKKMTQSMSQPKFAEPQAEAPSKHIPGRFVLSDQSRFEDSAPKTQGSAATQKKKVPKGVKQQRNSLDSVILLESKSMNALSILVRSFGAAHRKFEQKSKKIGNLVNHQMEVDGEVLASASAGGVKEAKAACAKLAMEKLKKICYTLVTKDNLVGSAVDRTNAIKTPKPEPEPEHLAEESKANRMMKLMGWSGKGSGLGKNEQGRTEPVKAVTVHRRSGLGLELKEGPEFRKNITKMIKDFKTSNADHDLVFAADFSKDERALIHLIARKFNIKSASYGQDEKRQLVLRRSVSHQQILEEVKAAGGSTEKYDLIPPEDN